MASLIGNSTLTLAMLLLIVCLSTLPSKTAANKYHSPPLLPPPMPPRVPTKFPSAIVHHPRFSTSNRAALSRNPLFNSKPIYHSPTRNGGKYPLLNPNPIYNSPSGNGGKYPLLNSNPIYHSPTGSGGYPLLNSNPVYNSPSGNGGKYPLLNSRPIYRSPSYKIHVHKTNLPPRH